MTEPVSADGQQANTPARQLLAVLNRASEDMEKSVNESCDYVAKLNAEFEQIVNAQLKESEEQVELFLRSHLDSLSSERDALLSQLTELRQEELKTLQATGRNLRKALVEKLDTLVNDFRRQVDESLQQFRETLEQSDNDNNAAIEAGRNSLRQAMPSYLASITEEIAGERQSLEEQHAGYQKMLEQQSNDSLNELVEHFSLLKTRLEGEGEAFLSAVDQSSEKLIADQSEKLRQRIEYYNLLEQKAGERVDSLSGADMNYLRELPGNFAESCHEMAELQVGQHTTLVRNLALQYRTEILSTVQEAEDQLQIVRADLQSMLRHFQNHYADQFEILLTRFEKSAVEFAEAQAAAPDLADNQEQKIQSINEKFGGIKQIISEMAKEKVSATEFSMEQVYEDFRSRLENTKKNFSDRIENSFRENQEELSRLQQGNEEHLRELNKKMDGLEQTINEAKELIRALDQASLGL